VELKSTFNTDGSLNELDVAGQVILAIGDTTPDASGNWKDDTARVSVSVTPGFLKYTTKDGFHVGKSGSVKFALNGQFKIKGITIAAQNLTVEVDAGTQGFLLINGSVTLPDLRNVSVQLGDGSGAGGLKVDLNTGQFMLSGFQIVLPNF